MTMKKMDHFFCSFVSSFVRLALSLFLPLLLSGTHNDAKAAPTVETSIRRDGFSVTACGITIPVGVDEDVPEQIDGLFVYNVETQEQLSYLRHHFRGGVMVHFLDDLNSVDERGDKLYDGNKSMIWGDITFSGWQNMGRSDTFPLSERGTVAFAVAPLSLMWNDTMFSMASFFDNNDNIVFEYDDDAAWAESSENMEPIDSCAVVDYRRESPTSMCVTYWWYCAVARTGNHLNSRISRYRDEEEPVSDNGLLDLTQLKEQYLSNETFLESGKGIFVRYGMEWNLTTRRSNEVWENLARAVNWWDTLNTVMVRVDCHHDNDYCTELLGERLPEQEENNDEEEEQGKQEQIDRLPLCRLYHPDINSNESDGYFQIGDTNNGWKYADVNVKDFLYGEKENIYYDDDMQIFMLDFVKNSTNWLPLDCMELQSSNELPLWTPCTVAEKDKIEPDTSGHIFQIEHRGHMEYLIENYVLTFIHFTNIEENPEPNQDVMSVFEELAPKHANLTEKAVVAFAVADAVTEEDLMNFQDWFKDNELTYDDMWFAVDNCNINFGVSISIGCSIGSYDGAHSHCFRRGYGFDICEASLGSEWDCDEFDEDDIPDLVKSFEFQITLAEEEHFRGQMDDDTNF